MTIRFLLLLIFPLLFGCGDDKKKGIDGGEVVLPELPVLPYVEDILSAIEDEVFRGYIQANIEGEFKEADLDANGILSSDEVKNIKKLNIALAEKISSLKGIEYFQGLEILRCVNNEIKELNLSYNTNLREFLFRDSYLEKLDLRYLPNLGFLYCYNNPYLEELDLSNNKKLNELVCDYTALSSLDVSKNVNLKKLYCPNTRLTSLDLTANVNLEILGCYDTPLTSVDLSNNIALKMLIVDLESLNIDKNINLSHLLIYDNSTIKEISIRNNVNLEFVRMEGTKIEKVYVWKGFDHPNQFRFNSEVEVIEID